jgi:hypothetical protein
MSRLVRSSAGLNQVAATAASRRRTVRIEVDGKLSVAIPTLNVDLHLKDMSFGGFAVVSPRSFWRGMTHWFTFSTRTGQSIMLVAKAVHCYAVKGEPRFVSGWEFMAGSADRTDRAIGQLLEELS